MEYWQTRRQRQKATPALTEMSFYSITWISILTSCGIVTRITRWSARSSACMSISLLWMRISHRSYVSEPSPSGDFLVEITSFFVGRLIGPEKLTPVLLAISVIWLTMSFSFFMSVLYNFIRALGILVSQLNTRVGSNQLIEGLKSGFIRFSWKPY